MIEQNVQTIRQLSTQNKKIMFVSNSSMKGRSYIHGKLNDFQIKVPVECVIFHKARRFTIRRFRWGSTLSATIPTSRNFW